MRGIQTTIVQTQTELRNTQASLSGSMASRVNVLEEEQERDPI